MADFLGFPYHRSDFLKVTISWYCRPMRLLVSLLFAVLDYLRYLNNEFVAPLPSSK